MRLLITGSRTWNQERTIEAQLLRAFWSGGLSDPAKLTVIHGGCRNGADMLASFYTRDLTNRYGSTRVEELPVLAAWWINGVYNNRAGIKRNESMVDNFAPDICLAFIDKHSRGATHCANYAASKGIPTYVWTDNTDDPDNYFQL